jgi:hypothetical protein
MDGWVIFFVGFFESCYMINGKFLLGTCFT